MVQANNYHIERSSNSRYFKGYCFSCNMFGHKAINFCRRIMKHITCYACNEFGHIAIECKKKQTSSHSKVWKKKEVQPKICGITQYADRIDLGGSKSMKFQCSNYHTKLY